MAGAAAPRCHVGQPVTSPSKRKGSAFERDVVAFFRDAGHPHVERSYGAGRPDDRGDIDGLPRWVLELKACKALDLAGWSDEAERERLAAGCDFAAVVAKRRGKPTGAAYVMAGHREPDASPCWQGIRPVRPSCRNAKSRRRLAW